MYEGITSITLFVFYSSNYFRIKVNTTQTFFDQLYYFMRLGMTFKMSRAGYIIHKRYCSDIHIQMKMFCPDNSISFSGLRRIVVINVAPKIIFYFVIKDIKKLI